MDNNHLFYVIIHPMGMVLAATFITIGHSRAKKSKTSRAKFRKTLIWFLAGLAIVLLSIPWPFIFPNAGWA